MTLTQFITAFDRLKVKKVRGEKRWRVIDTYLSSRWSYIAEFDSKKEAEDFIIRRAMK